jgi:hypothetical protein
MTACNRKLVLTLSPQECWFRGEMCASRIKQKCAVTLLVSLAVLCGCAHQYLIKLNNGDQIVSFSKPNLQESNYHFTDSTGVKHVLPQSRVVKIQTISVVTEEEKPVPSAKPQKPKHWYFLWLA